MSIAPFRFRALPSGDIVCVSDAGSAFRASADFVERFGSGSLLDADRAYLDNRGDLLETDHGLAWESYAHGVARRLSVANRLDYLILVPTLRCNLSCDYCQVSRAAEKARGFDWTDETLRQVLEFIDCLETPSIKIEFQGGEPTLRSDLIAAVIERCARFERAEFVVCTNLQQLSAEILSIFDRPDVFISTSLDGGPGDHERHRTQTKARTGEFLSNLEALYRRYGPGKISALPTIDPRSPPEPSEIIDAYVSFGIHNIFLRPINFHGFARRRYKESVEQSQSWASYYEGFVHELIRRNWEDRSRVLQETYFGICLRRIFKPGLERHVDLRNPNPIGTDYLLVDYDGKFYPSDEARMLARSGIIDLSIGDLQSGIDEARKQLMNRSASNTFDPDCQRCAYQPFCGRDLIDDLARYGRIDLSRTETEFCRKHRGIFDFVFALIFSDDPAVRYSLCRWLGLPGEIELAEVAP